MTSSIESSLTTSPPIKTHLHLLSYNDPTVTTPDPSDIRIIKPESTTFGSGSNLTKLASSVASKRLSFLSQKYEVLCEFFNAMVSSIRLFRLKRLSSTFARLSRNIESLTKRRFTLHHLAQMKQIVPEVIMVKKIRVQDQGTNCMEEELLVSLEVDAMTTDEDIIGRGGGGGGFSRLKGIFLSRLTDYSLTHDEDEDVPEEELPMLFYKPKQESEPSICITSTPFALSHTAPSFKKRFSSRVSSALKSESCLAEPSVCLPETPMKEAIATGSKDGSFISTVEANAPAVKFVSTPAKLVSTPVKLVSTPERLMAATPTLLPPKRPLMTPDHDYSSDLPTKAAKRRALNFEHSSNDIEDQWSHVCEERISHPDLSQSLIEKDVNILEELDLSSSLEKTRQQLMDGVANLLDMILHLFQSIRRSAITKEELIHKLIAGHLDFVDRREVEKQLKLLQELAPECISELQSVSGDTLICHNKASCPESIRIKVLEAK